MSFASSDIDPFGFDLIINTCRVQLLVCVCKKGSCYADPEIRLLQRDRRAHPILYHLYEMCEQL